MAGCRHTLLYENQALSRQDNRLPARTRLDCAPPEPKCWPSQELLHHKVGALSHTHTHALRGSLPRSLRREFTTRSHFRHSVPMHFQSNFRRPPEPCVSFEPRTATAGCGDHQLFDGSFQWCSWQHRQWLLSAHAHHHLLSVVRYDLFGASSKKQLCLHWTTWVVRPQRKIGGWVVGQWCGHMRECLVECFNYFGQLHLALPQIRHHEFSQTDDDSFEIELEWAKNLIYFQLIEHHPINLLSINNAIC